MALYIGLMSGTSLDAIDAAVVDITDNKVSLKNATSYPIPEATKQQLLKLINGNGEDTIDLLGEVDAKMGQLFAESTLQLLTHSSLKAKDITAIGSHGQTIRHRPNQKHAFTLQIGDASRIAERTGITTVTDFRRRDIAAGGQGAPLVPAFHRSAFGSADEHRCIINIGGMANISYLPKDTQDKTSGFDTGPGNVLLDSWCLQNTGNSYDKNGDWGKSGRLNPTILKQMLSDDYFSLAAPKSTGREHFNIQWLHHQLQSHNESTENIQSCLTELTARSISDAIEEYYPETERLILCGGGCHNLFLRQRLQENLKDKTLDDSSGFGIDPDWVEAVAFSWLAHCTLNNIPANEPAVTGAHSPVVLGAIYPA